MREDIHHSHKTFESVKFQEKEVADRVFTKCTFKKCNLYGLIFIDCAFDECHFEECDISLIKVKHCSFSKVTINKCKAIGILWFESSNPLSVSFSNSAISFSSFFGKNLKKFKFINCVAEEVDFSECNLTEASFEGTNLLQSRFLNCDLSLTNFVDAKNYGININANKIKKTKFSLPDAMNLLNDFDIEIVN